MDNQTIFEGNAGDLIFSIGRTFLSRNIIKFQKKFNLDFFKDGKTIYTHVAIAMTDYSITMKNRNVVYSSGLILDSTYPFNRIADIRVELKHEFAIARHKDMDNNKCDKVIKYILDKAFWRFMSGYIGKPYDILMILSYPIHNAISGIKTRNVFNSDTFYVCSELQYDAFIKNGLPINFSYKIDKSNIGPSDIFYSCDFVDLFKN